MGVGAFSITNVAFKANEDATQKTISAVILALYAIQLLLLFLWIKCEKRRKILKILICLLTVGMCILAFEVLVAGVWVLEEPSKDIRLASFISGIGIGILLWQTIKYIGYWWVKALLFTACMTEFMGRLIDSKQSRLLYLIPFLLIISLAVFLLYADQKLSGKEFRGFQNQRTLKKRWKDFVKCSMPLPLLIVDKSLNVRFYNDSFKTTFGLQNYQSSQGHSQILELLNSTYVDKNSLPMFTGTNASPRIRPVEELQVETHSTLIQSCDSRNSFTLKTLLSLEEVKNFSFQEGIKINHCKIYNFQSRTTDVLEYELRLNTITWKNDGCFLLMFQDTTIVQLNEKLKQINMYKDMLLATVSHDLRTPINGMLNVLDTIEPDITPEHRPLLKICRDSGDLLLLMINDILDFSQIQNQKLKLSFTTAVTRKIVTEVVDLVRLQAEKKGLELKTDVDIDVPTQIYTDPVRLKQILLNLLTNALKFTKQGYIKVSAKLHIFRNNKQIQFAVEDTGIGIKDEDKEKLFKLFGKIEHKNPEINK